MTKTNHSLNEKAKLAATCLATLRDEIPLKAHLAKMEGRDAWNSVREDVDRMLDRLQSFSERMTDTKEEAELQAHLGLMEARERWAKVNDVMTALIDKTKPILDTARLKTHLARMDSEQAAEDYAAAFKETWHHSKQKAIEEAEHGIDRLIDSLEALKRKL